MDSEDRLSGELCWILLCFTPDLRSIITST